MRNDEGAGVMQHRLGHVEDARQQPTTMIFGTPVDITLSELAVETFFPADDLTAERMRAMAANLK